MACPWFFPVERLGTAESMLPLGDVWNGECRAPGMEPAAPDRAGLIRNCNLGYARGVCRRVPAEGADAVRFAIACHEGPTVNLCCVLEREYLPFSRLDLNYDVEAGRFTAPQPEAVIARQARAYLESYLLRKNRS